MPSDLKIRVDAPNILAAVRRCPYLIIRATIEPTKLAKICPNTPKLNQLSFCMLKKRSKKTLKPQIFPGISVSYQFPFSVHQRTPAYIVDHRDHPQVHQTSPITPQLTHLSFIHAQGAKQEYIEASTFPWNVSVMSTYLICVQVDPSTHLEPQWLSSYPQNQHKCT